MTEILDQYPWLWAVAGWLASTLLSVVPVSYAPGGFPVGRLVHALIGNLPIALKRKASIPIEPPPAA